MAPKEESIEPTVQIIHNHYEGCVVLTAQKIVGQEGLTRRPLRRNVEAVAGHVENGDFL